MDLNAASSFVRLAQENHFRYEAAMQRELLNGIYQIADHCIEEIDQLEDDEEYREAREEIELMKQVVTSALESGDFTDGFRLAHECFERAVPLSLWVKER
jgi:gamma-glutamylcyclotransferase (GGCT)/AIG2-like uncharacterized protein YtfP